MPRIREAFDGMQPFVVCAAVLVVFGVFCIFLELQSASVVQWDGIKVHGDTHGGVTTYRYAGLDYSIDNTAISADDERHLPTTVWLARDDPTNPERAFIESPWDRWTDFVFVTGWFFGALLLLLAGFIRATLRHRERETRMLEKTFGTGLDPEVIERILAERRRPPPVIDVDESGR
jgi:hypothetical protein